MGTDIHLYAEVRRDDGWQYVEGPKSPTTLRWGGDGSFWDARNYRLFGLLADVRNGCGSAGCDTGDPVIPIAPPKGLPADLSPEVAKIAREYLEHTPSWLTAREVLQYPNWDTAVAVRGMVSREQAREFGETGEPPTSYCAATTDTTDVQIQWDRTPRESAGGFLRMVEYVCDYLRAKPEDVRFTFWFDS